MAKAPWYKRYAADFVSDPYVQAMTAEQYGWYSAMLDISWIHTPIGRLPNDFGLICKMVGRCDEIYFKQHSKIVFDRFKTSEDGCWIYHPKLLEQAEKVAQISENKSHPKKAGRKPIAPNTDDKKCKSSDFHLITDSDSDSDKKISNRATQLPKDFQPKPKHKEMADSLGVNLNDSFAAFVDFHTSKGSTFKDWDAALRTWLRNDRKFAKSAPKKSTLDELYAN